MNHRIRYSLTGLLTGSLFPVAALLLSPGGFGGGFVGSPAFYVLLAVVPAFSLAGYVHGLSRDNTDTKYTDLMALADQRSNSMHSMLDISGQAVFTFGHDFKVHNEYSSFCDSFFESSIGGRDVRDLLFEREEDKVDFTQGIDLLFQGSTDSDVVFDVFDNELEIHGRITEVSYRFVAPSRVLVGLSDITESKTLTQRIVQEERGKEMVFTAVSHQQYFRDLLRDAEDVFFRLDSIIASGIQDREKISNLQRALHTLKGNLSFFSFRNTHDLVDELENYIADMLALEEPLDFQGQGLALKRVYFQELRKIVDTLGEDWLAGVDAIHISRRQFQQLMNYIQQEYSNDNRLLKSLVNFYKLPMRSLFSQYPHMAKTIASRLGKAIEPMEIQGGDFPVIPDSYRELSTCAVHLIRNMIDHGIEAPFERQSMGKQPEGKIGLSIRMEHRAIILQFTDDGRGIDYGAITQRAVRAGFLAEGVVPGKAELTKLLFRKGFSTAEMVTSISGKGLGLNAVKIAVKKLGGTIHVKSRDNEGTAFTIRLPLEEAVNEG